MSENPSQNLKKLQQKEIIRMVTAWVFKSLFVQVKFCQTFLLQKVWVESKSSNQGAT